MSTSNAQATLSYGGIRVFVNPGTPVDEYAELADLINEWCNNYEKTLTIADTAEGNIIKKMLAGEDVPETNE